MIAVRAVYSALASMEFVLNILLPAIRVLISIALRRQSVVLTAFASRVGAILGRLWIMGLIVL